MTLGAVIFDMDGVLIDTEPVWRRVESAVLTELGCDVTEDAMVETMGVPLLDVVKLWHSRHPWPEPSIDAVAEQILEGMLREVSATGEPMPGVHEALAAAREAGLRTAIASSSSLRLITAVVQRLGIKKDVDALCTADDEEAGKPHPAVYLRAAQRLGVAPERCLAIEDSPNGVRSALAAGMVCVAIPDPGHAGHEVMAAAHYRLPGLGAVDVNFLTTAGVVRGEVTPG